MKFGEYLLSQGICSSQQIASALKVGKYCKKKLGRLLVELGYLDEEKLDSALIRYLKPQCVLPYKELTQKAAKLSRQTQRQFAKYKVVPIFVDSHRVSVVSTIFSDALISEIEADLRLEVNLLIVDAPTFKRLVSRVDNDRQQQVNITVASELDCAQKCAENSAYARLIKNCLKEATSLKASDIHFEPFAACYLIRFRVYGTLHDWKQLSNRHSEAITNKLKWILGLDLAVSTTPQDARASFAGLGVDVRANSLPLANGGEKIVLRLQYLEEKLSLTQIGLSPKTIKTLRYHIQKTEGLIVISGPTGSGKTTTLYALLDEMDRLGKNISTLENPVEKTLDRINQASIATEKDFYEFQRALMRQDPDVILLGEIRDAETADLSMKLASTGHLVLSTIHANGAREVIDRLANLGVDQYTIDTNLRLAIAQRLLRRLCEYCRIQNGEFYLRDASGCKHCQKGVSGRIAIIEYIDKKHLRDRKSPTTLHQECEQLVNKGVIDALELNSFTETLEV